MPTIMLTHFHHYIVTSKVICEFVIFKRLIAMHRLILTSKYNLGLKIIKVFPVK